MSKVAIVTDSTTGFPEDVVSRYHLTSVPLQVIWGKDTYLDSVDITQEQFYKKLATAEVMPTTSQPSPKAFYDVYTRLLDEGYEILNILISSKLSGTVNSAVQAKEMLPDKPIEIVDSLTTAMQLGLQVMKTCDVVQAGATLEEAKKIAEDCRDRSRIYFVVNTLEFLHRGGRIGGASAFLGTMLNLKPLLTVQEGVIEAVEKIRTQKKALQRMLDIVKENVADRKLYGLAVIHADAKGDADELLDRLTGQFGFEDKDRSVCAGVSPVIGTHVGPGCLGVCYLLEE